MTGLDDLLSAVESLHRATPTLQAYGPWPDDLQAANLTPQHAPIADKLGAMGVAGTEATEPVLAALRQAAADLHWKQTYTEAEVGAHFLDNYGYVELFGPGGQFHSAKLRGFIGVWGPDLFYDWHAHTAEERYFTLAGQAVFVAEGEPNILLQPGQTRTHRSSQTHLMITLDQPIFTYVLWRGDGLDRLPEMVAA